MTTLHFTKLQGCGNDYILIDDRVARVPEQRKSALARRLCHRRFSVGADGLLFLCEPSSTSFDVQMRIFNPDGSEAEMCGNGMRCFARYVYERGVVRTQRITSVRVFMGKPVFDRLDERFRVNDAIGEVKLTSLSLGNPHAILMLNSFEDIDLDKVGKAIESHPAFPNRTNVDFVVRSAEKASEISVRTYERGVGETLSCGTGSTASVLALHALGYVPLHELVVVHTLGGDLLVEVTEEGAYLQGPAEVVYEGQVNVGW
jgi:diaminopimelate epimerase